LLFIENVENLRFDEVDIDIIRDLEIDFPDFNVIEIVLIEVDFLKLLILRFVFL
jgi:hypothetical protein